MQANLNHARHAQELLLQYMDERDLGMAVIAEPYRVPTEHPAWAGAPDGSVAITWRRTRNLVPCNREEAVDSYVLVRWGSVLIMGVYLPPRLCLAEYEERLDRMERAVRARPPAPIIIMGDFNAHATMWGSRRTNANGLGEHNGALLYEYRHQRHIHPTARREHCGFDVGLPCCDRLDQ